MYAETAAAAACQSSLEQPSSDLDAFRSAERRFRQQTRVTSARKKGRIRTVIERLPDDPDAWASILDPRAPNTSRLVCAETIFTDAGGAERAVRLISVPEAPGLYVLPALLAPAEQLAWARRAVQAYIEPPNATSLDAQYGPQRGLWRRACAEDDEEAGEGEGRGAGELLRALRWATLGYQYLWTERTYEEGRREAFPAELAALARRLAAAVGAPAFEAQAAIVNFYPPGSSIGGHIDDAELEAGAPILSLSLGPAAVFLVGGRTRGREPAALLLRSGDVVAMGGASRLAYHGVPRVLPNSLPDDLRAALAAAGPADRPLAAFLAERRININVRQVLPAGVAAYTRPAHAAPAELEGAACAPPGHEAPPSPT